MTSTTMGLMMFAGIGALTLIMASVISEIRLFKYGVSEKWTRLNDRIASWWVVLTIFFLTSILGSIGFVVLFGLCAFATLREFLTLIDFERGDHWSLLLMIFVILPLQFIWVGTGLIGMMIVFIPVYAYFLLPMISALRGSNRRFLPRITQYQWALMLCVYSMSHIPALMFIPIEGYADRGQLLVVFFIFVVEMAGTLQHVIGKLIRSRQLAAHISKSRTMAGFFGGILGASILGAFFHFITPFGMMGAFLMGVLAATVGLLGSFVMTAIKRDRGVRDYGDAISGHGGLLDGMDALLFAAPVFFHVTRYFWG